MFTIEARLILAGSFIEGHCMNLHKIFLVFVTLFVCIPIHADKLIDTKKEDKKKQSLMHNKFLQASGAGGSAIAGYAGYFRYDYWKNNWIQKTAQTLRDAEGKQYQSSSTSDLTQFLSAASEQFKQHIAKYPGGSFVDGVHSIAGSIVQTAWENQLVILAAGVGITFWYFNSQEEIENPNLKEATQKLQKKEDSTESTK